ncbi:MAG: tetratricopeptide repeat protein, partial [Planctomycetota bacterium]
MTEFLMTGSARFVSLSLIWLAAIAVLIPADRAIAGGGPENVLLVVNRASDSSKMFANHYISLRDIPARNVVYLDDVPNTERIRIADFKNLILLPLLEQVQERGLSGNIDYIVYSTDFPTIIWVRGQRDRFLELVNEQGGRVANSKKLFNPWASITSMTYFTSMFINNDVSYFSLESNSYFRGENRGLLTRPFAGETQDRFEDAVDDSRNGNLDEAIAAFEVLAEEHPNQVAVSYWLARTYATMEEPVESARWLARAVSAGWAFKDYTASDLAFEKVRRHEAFKSVLDRMGNQNFRFYPTHGFRGTYRWGPNGMINSAPDQGSAFVLSTVLGVT